MKHLLLINFLFAGFLSFSQINPCIPNVNLQDSTFGLWPDTIDNLPLATMNEYYEEHIQIKTPNTVGEVLGNPYEITVGGFPVNIAPLAIDSIKLVDIQNLPNTMSTYLSNADSVFEGNFTACVTLYGTPGDNDIGQHDLSLLINGWISVGNLTVSLYEQLNQYQSIDGYKFIVLNSSSIDNESISPFSISQNVPNPFNTFSTIELYSPSKKHYDFIIIDLMGRVIYKETIQATLGINNINIDATNYPSGVYFYTVSDGQHLITKKLTIVSH